MKLKTLFGFLIASALAATVACSPDETIYKTAPEPDFEMSATTVERGETVRFTDRSVPLDGTQIVEWAWNFDFGNDENTSAVSAEQNPTYAYDRTGTFTVRLVVTDSQGAFASVMKTITVETPYSELAHAAFDISTEKATIGEAISFTDRSEPAEGASIAQWEWDFGENEESVSAEQNPSYTYSTSGSFTVTLKITDSKGNTSSASHDLLVMDPADLVSILWQKPLLGAVQNTLSPAMSPDGKTVYMWADQTASDAYDTALKAYDVETGAEKWTFDINADFAQQNPGGGVRQVFASPAVGPNGDIYICARDLKNSGAARKSYLYAVKADGTKRWHYAFGIDANFNYMTPAVDAEGKIYVGHLTNSPFEIAVLDPTTGSKLNAIPLSVGVRSGISLDRSGNVYFCSTGKNGMYSYGAASKSMNWQYNTNVSTTGGDITIGADGTVYTVIAGSASALVAAVNPTSGTQKWEYALPGAASYGGVVIGADGTIFANGGERGGVVALNADGTLKWNFATEENVTNCVPLVDNRGYVHFITDKGTYYVVTDEGLLYGQKSLGAKSFASPVMNAEGKVCIAVEDADAKSYVICLDTGATGYADSAWPMKGQNPQRTHLQRQ